MQPNAEKNVDPKLQPDMT